jgi:hypothetical protein
MATRTMNIGMHMNPSGKRHRKLILLFLIPKLIQLARKIPKKLDTKTREKFEPRSWASDSSETHEGMRTLTKPIPKPEITRAQMNMLALTEPHCRADPTRELRAPTKAPFFRPYLSPNQPPMKAPNMAPK